MVDFFDVNIIAQRIKSRREELGLTQDDLAKLVGFSSRSSINKIENPQKNTASDNEVRDITIGRINQIAEALDTSSLYIVGIVNTPSTLKQDNVNKTKLIYTDTQDAQLLAAESSLLDEDTKIFDE